MVESDIFKENIKNIVSQDYNLEFLGHDFDKIVSGLTDKKSEDIYSWIRKVISKEIDPILVGSKKRYKDWLVHKLLSFRKEINIKGNDYRIMFIKVKNSFYIEFHLGKHKYYDSLRKKLGLTNKNYY